MKETDNGLDDLFKSGLSNGEEHIDYREQDWEALEEALDGRGTRRGAILRRLPAFISVAAAILLLFMGWLFTRPATQNKQEATQAKNNTPALKDTGNYGRQAQQTADLATKKPLSAGVKALNSADRNSRESNSFFFTLSAAAAGHTTTGKQQFNSAVPPVTNLQGEPTPAQASTAVKDTTPQYVASAVQPRDTTPPPARADMSSVNSGEMVAATVKVTKPIASSGFRPQFAISALVSPDLNGVKTFAQSKVGTNVGLLLHLKLSPKWSISTGAIYADKPYSTAFSNYTTSYAFKATPTTVDANCRVLDIPLNVDYRFYQKNRNNFSIGTGLSSYFMLRENYLFNYGEDYNTPPLAYNIKDQNKHILGVLNLNATYQREVSAKVGIGIQPYVKLPLTSIGYGQVNLRSAGVAFSLMYNLNTLTKPK